MLIAAFDVADACRAAAAELAEAWSRAFSCKLQISPLPAQTLELAQLPAPLATEGLLVCVRAEDSQRWLAVAHQNAVLPDWYRAPDPTGESRLSTLAQELGLSLFDDSALPDQFVARHVPNLRQSLASELAGTPRLQCMRWQLKPADGSEAEAFLFWSASTPTASASKVSAPASPAPAAKQPAPPTRASVPPAVAAGSRDSLPPYSRSLLKIPLPVSVTLAHKKQLASQILELGPGAIIQFDRSCEETLDLEVGGLRVALGEAVKVGDKFGLRITEMVSPSERFQPIRRQGS